MKFKKRHNRNGRQHEVGDRYVGDVDGARFLYHRGVIEPDGHPMDEFVTSAKPVRGAAWSDTDTFQSEDAPPTEVGETENTNGNEE